MSESVSQALARKWRPRDFESLVGQQHVVQALSHALDNNRLHHAYLFTGTRGVGKTTIARILAKAVNCEKGMSRKPCGQCQACLEISQGRFVDLLEVDAATNTKVDEMRALLENAMYAPTAGRYKVYVIDEVHMLSSSAFNAMLKTLEEPPGHVLFILATTDPQKIPATVLSRCLQFSLRQLLPDQIASHLATILDSEGISHEAAALRLIAKAARGSLRDALSLTDQAIAYSAGQVSEATVRQMLGAVDQQVIVQILTALAQGDGKQLLDISKGLATVSAPFASLLDELAACSYRLSVATFTGGLDTDDPDAAALAAVQSLFTPEDLQLFYQIATHARAELHLAPEDQIGFSMALLRMLAFKPGGAELIAPRSSAAAPAPAPAPARSLAAPIAVSKKPTMAQPAPVAAPAPAPAAAKPVESTTPRPPSGDLQLPSKSSWPEFSQQVAATGLTRQALVQAELVKCEQHDNAVVLTLKTAIKAYTEGLTVTRMEKALSDHLGCTVKLDMQHGEVQQTAHAVNTEQRKQAFDEARQAIQEDPFLSEISKTMGASVVPGSERPLHVSGPADV
ncbi:MAG TPA: DNA polymerase III subunit gamma/tau [Limnobacter sp.]|uniref:DNA polymerase III subunit gamma/tau n=1 Tax=Limnobacter sp. TaxID=2003368 RepID=UPI002E31E9CA|nr:DNA polymerase III subunit gamma/tau [Limnobacter sp.]HEX5485307.1 DNA polymerase III subunit gamma/tau [Limnobacter sp.]